MRLVIQRVTQATVAIDGAGVGEIGTGLMVLVGVREGDTEADVQWLAQKTVNMRIFNDDEGVMNRSVSDVGGNVLAVSQFTLNASTKKGNRPSFIDAGEPKSAEALYEYILSEARKQVEVVEHGIFGADMKVSLENDGPFTIILDDHIL